MHQNHHKWFGKRVIWFLQLVVLCLPDSPQSEKYINVEYCYKLQDSIPTSTFGISLVHSESVKQFPNLFYYMKQVIRQFNYIRTELFLLSSELWRDSVIGKNFDYKDCQHHQLPKQYSIEFCSYFLVSTTQKERGRGEKKGIVMAVPNCPFWLITLPSLL